MNNTTTCIKLVYELDNLVAFFISQFIIIIVSFTVLEILYRRWKLKNRHFCSKKRNNIFIWFYFVIVALIVSIPFPFLVKKIVYLIIL